MVTGEDELTQTQPVAARVQRSHAKWGRVRVVYPPEVLTTIDLSGTQGRVLGRGPTEPHGLKIPHRTVSRSHVGLDYSAALRCWTIRDRGSRNGTWADGVKVGEEPLALADGSIIRMGDVLAVFEWCTGELTDDAAVSTDALYGDSVRMIKLREEIGRVAADPSPALVIGDTGTGKELCSSELHRLSGRAGPLVSFNCAELSESVVESQLFGHEKGAFTGATVAHPGLFRSADGGSLFLDEIGELPLALQPKLLRVLQTGEVMSVGGSKKTTIDVRIIAATNRNLTDEVDAGSFRRDLYARLAIHEIRIPALRRRRSDLLGWLDVLARAWAKRRGRDSVALALSPDAAELVLRGPWQENLRGLDRLVHALAPLADQGAIEADQLPPWASGNATNSIPAPATAAPAAPEKASAPARPAIPNREALMAALDSHAWVIQAVARHYGRDRRQIYRWMDNHAIKRRD